MTSFATLGADTSDTTGVAVTAGDNTKGSWFELTSSLSIDAEVIYLFVDSVGTDSTSAYAIDVGTGASASETVRLSNIPKVNARGGEGSWYALNVDPTVFASGTRVAVRAEGSSGGGTRILDVIGYAASTAVPLLTGGATISYGVTLGGDNKLISLDPGGTAHTKSSYTEVTSSFSSTGQYCWLCVYGDQNTALTDGKFLIDIATGAAASESVLIANLCTRASSSLDKVTPELLGPFKSDDMQGARVAVRVQSDIIDAADRIIRVALLAATGTVASSGASGGEGPLIGGRLVL